MKKAIKKKIIVKYRTLAEDASVNTLVGIENAKKRDVLLQNPPKDSYPISKEKFQNTYDKIDNSRAVKKSIPIYCKQLTQNIDLKTNWGIQKGKKGDYLAFNYNDITDKWIIDRELFKDTYDIVD